MLSGVSAKSAQHPVFSFADGEMGPVSNGIIRTIEKLTGQPRIRRLYHDYVIEDRPPGMFWQDAVERLNLRVNLAFDPGAYIPPTGRLLVIANHPFGVIDGLILCSEISKIRSDYKIITHQVLRQAPAVMHQILPIDFNLTETAMATNLETRNEAMQHLRGDGTVIIFPSGAISLAPKLVGPAEDSEWKTFAAKLALVPDTQVLPVFFEGQNSLAYMVARKLSLTLGYSMMFREICRRIGSEVKATVRRPVAAETLRQLGSRQEVIAYLRHLTYGTEA